MLIGFMWTEVFYLSLKLCSARLAAVGGLWEESDFRLFKSFLSLSGSEVSITDARGIFI